MYKRFFISIFLVLTLASCTKEETVRDITVQFNATVSPEILTKGAGTKAGNAEEVIADHAVLQAWLGDALVVNVEKDNIVSEDNQIDFGVIKLVGGVDYDVYFWVDVKDYYNTSDLRSVSVKNDYKGNTPNFDAFYAYIPFNCSQSNEMHNVILGRPFAKVCFSAQGDSQLAVNFTAPTTLNLKTGEVSDNKNFSYEVNPEGSSVTAYDYIFATKEGSQLSYTFKLGDEEEKNISVPVKRNTKTNIIYNITN